LERAIVPQTALIVVNAASNVTGALAPVVEAGEIAHAHGVPFLVDGAQVAGHLPLALSDLPVDLWACPGHKGLLGPQGIGVLYLRPGLELPPLLQGGAGFESAQTEMPEAAPERYEAGTLNTPGILGLGAAAEHLLAADLSGDRARSVALSALLVGELSRVPGVEIFTAPAPQRGVGLVSCRIAGWSPSRVAEVLDADFGICVRAGLHCAPLAHAALGTAPNGTVRFSLGHATTVDDVKAAVAAVTALAKRPDLSPSSPAHHSASR
jgi:selenocysteine lyase/cysteine desulfurase